MNRKIIVAVLSVVLLISAICGISISQSERNNNAPVLSQSSVSENYSQTDKSEKNKIESTSENETNSSAENSESTNPPSTRGKESKRDKNTSSRENSSSVSEKTTKSAPSKTESSEIKVSISITCFNAIGKADVPKSGYFLKSTSVTAGKGASVFDVLSSVCSENGISLKYRNKAYIQGIGGLNEKDCGGQSGWMYRVNGKLPNKAASKYLLADGDVIEWFYVTSPNDK
ncbi:MAG: DUF4430 domain-containing protein [Clostridiales bacterium]|nr:DUF4430 domain-containing protein [Clostridiales bacterium]